MIIIIIVPVLISILMMTTVLIILIPMAIPQKNKKDTITKKTNIHKEDEEDNEKT